MGFWASLLGRGAESRQVESQKADPPPPGIYAMPWQVGRAVGARSPLGDLPGHYGGWVYAAVRAISQGCSACPVRFFTERDGREEALPETHPLRRLLDEVNPFHTYRELIESTVTDLELTGNAFWLLSRRELSRVPAEIWPVPPAWMRIVPGQGEFVREYRILRGGRETSLDPEEVVHFRYASPGDPWWGRGPLEAAIDAVRADESIARAQRAVFENGPLPGVLLRTQHPMTRDQQDRLHSLFESRHSGPEAAGRLIIADGEAEITPFTTSPREMDFVESARATRDRILGVFGVPPAVLGLVEDFNRANAEAAGSIFARETLLPKLTLLSARITQDLCSQFLPSGVRCRFDSPVPEDRDSARRDMEAGVRLGVISPNEARTDFYGKRRLDDAGLDSPRPVGARAQATSDQATSDQATSERE